MRRIESCFQFSLWESEKTLEIDINYWKNDSKLVQETSKYVVDFENMDVDHKQEWLKTSLPFLN